VAEDLEAIFPNAPSATGGRRLRLGGRGETTEGRVRLEGRGAAVGAMIAAACVGVSAGALLARGAAIPGSPPAAHVQAPRTVVAAAPAPSPEPLAPAALRAAVSQPIAPTAASRPAPPRRQISAAKVHKVVARAPSRARRVRSAVCHGSHCSGSLMAADARLRRAYTSAVRAGVSRGVLIDYRDDWERLRHRAPYQPGLVAARYNQMAGDLNRMAGRRRVASPAPRSVGPWRSLRTELASLWR
jgi:hypothetical protein